MENSIFEPRKDLIKGLAFLIICIAVCSVLAFTTSTTWIFVVLLYAMYLGSGIIFYCRTFLAKNIPKNSSMTYSVITVSYIALLWAGAVSAALIFLGIVDDRDRIFLSMAVLFMAATASPIVIVVFENLLPRSDAED